MTSVKAKVGSRTVAPARIKKLLSGLEREDTKLSARLLNAAVAGAAVALHPSDPDFRRGADSAWRDLEPMISHHLKSDGETVLSWAESRAQFPHDLVVRAHERHQKLRRLVRRLVDARFRAASDSAVKKAGRALCALAVHLDDLIAGEERTLFPLLHRRLFADQRRIAETRSAGQMKGTGRPR